MFHEKDTSFGFDRSMNTIARLDKQATYWHPHEFMTEQNIQVITG